MSSRARWAVPWSASPARPKVPPNPSTPKIPKPFFLLTGFNPPVSPAMRRLPLRLLRSAASSPRRRPAPSPPPSPNPAAPPALLSRWGWGWAPPRRGYSRFATGFTPLQPKPLASILDVERASGLSPDHLVAAWDDVSASSFPFVLLCSVFDVPLTGSPPMSALEDRPGFISRLCFQN